MIVNSNLSALRASYSLANNDNALSESLQKLSSGYKINRAKDNPSGFAVATRMNSQLTGLSVAGQNVDDGISVIETAEGTLAEIQAMVQRIGELATRASGSNFSEAERTQVQDEINETKNSMQELVKGCTFNGNSLLSGDFDLKGYSNTTGVSLGYYSDEVKAGQYSLSITRTVNGDGSINEPTVDMTSLTGFPSIVTAEYIDNAILMKNEDGFEMRVDLDDSTTYNNTTVNLEATGLGAMRLQVGPNEGQVLKMRIPAISMENLQLADADVTTTEGAKKAIEAATYANDFISGVRSRLGSYQNCLERMGTSIDSTNENLTSAYSRIMDVDMATEVTEYSRLQVMTQAGTSILAQANERPSQLLQLLQ